MYTSGENSELAAKQIRSWERQQKEEYRRKKEEIRKKLNSPDRAATSEAVNTDEAENFEKTDISGTESSDDDNFQPVRFENQSVTKYCRKKQARNVLTPQVTSALDRDKTSDR